MPMSRTLFNLRFDETKLGARLVARRAAMEKSGIRTLADLRRASRSPQDLRFRGFDDQDVKTATEFASLARLFPAEIAIALQEAGADCIEALKSWQPDQFQQALEKVGFDPDRIEYEGHASTDSKAF